MRTTTRTLRRPGLGQMRMSGLMIATVACPFIVNESPTCMGPCTDLNAKLDGSWIFSSREYTGSASPELSPSVTSSRLVTTVMKPGGPGLRAPVDFISTV